MVPTAKEGGDLVPQIPGGREDLGNPLGLQIVKKNCQKRTATDRRHGLWKVANDGSHSGSEASGENDSLHHLAALKKDIFHQATKNMSQHQMALLNLECISRRHFQEEIARLAHRSAMVTRKPHANELHGTRLLECT